MDVLISFNHQALSFISGLEALRAVLRCYREEYGHASMDCSFLEERIADISADQGLTFDKSSLHIMQTMLLKDWLYENSSYAFSTTTVVENVADDGCLTL